MRAAGESFCQYIEKNKFPEPQWVKFVNENILWVYLVSMYKS